MGDYRIDMVSLKNPKQKKGDNMVSYENEKKGRIPLIRDLMNVLGCMRMYMVRSPEKPNRQVIGRDEKGDEFWLPHNDALQHIYNDFHGNFLEITNVGGKLEDGKKNYTFKVVVLERVEDDSNILHVVVDEDGIGFAEKGIKVSIKTLRGLASQSPDEAEKEMYYGLIGKIEFISQQYEGVSYWEVSDGDVFRPSSRVSFEKGLINEDVDIGGVFYYDNNGRKDGEVEL